MKRFLLVALLASTAAIAEEPKKVDFTQPLMDDTEPLVDDFACPRDKDGSRTCQTPFTLGEIVFRALRAPEQGVTFEEGLKRDDLARAVRKSKDWPLLDADRDTIKRQVARVFASPVLMGIVNRMMSPK